RLGAGDLQQSYLAVVRVQHLEVEAVEGDGFTPLGKASEAFQDQAANGVELGVVQISVEEFVEFIDGGQDLDGELRGTQRLDPAFTVNVVLVLDLTDDLLQNVFDGHQARHATIFVHHNGHVVAVAAKFLQQMVEPLALRHKGGRAQDIQHFVLVQVAVHHQAQQVFGQQDA